jgi:hypothetical protein
MLVSAVPCPETALTATFDAGASRHVVAPFPNLAPPTPSRPGSLKNVFPRRLSRMTPGCLLTGKTSNCFVTIRPAPTRLQLKRKTTLAHKNPRPALINYRPSHRSCKKIFLPFSKLCSRGVLRDRRRLLVKSVPVNGLRSGCGGMIPSVRTIRRATRLCRRIKDGERTK